MIQDNKYKKITEAKFAKEVLSQMGKIDSSVTQNYISFIFYLLSALRLFSGFASW